MQYHQSPVIANVQQRLWQQNQNWIALVLGEPGSGKSRTSLSLADMIDPNFSSDNILFDPVQFVDQVIEHLEHLQSGDQGTFPRGTAVVLEELGVAIKGRNAMNQFNKALSDLFQTFRKTNLAVIGNVPSNMMVDKDVRRLCHSLVVTDYIDFNQEACRVQWLEINHNPVSDQISLSYPRVQTKNGLPRTIKSVWVPNPRPSLIQDYEKGDTENKLKIAQESRKTMLAAAKKEQKQADKWLNSS